MRELQGDVRAQALVDETRDDRLVLGDDGARLRFVADALAEKRRVCEEAAVVRLRNTRTPSSRVSPATNRPAPSRIPCFWTTRWTRGTVGGGEDRAAHCVVGSRRETHSIGEPKR